MRGYVLMARLSPPELELYSDLRGCYRWAGRLEKKRATENAPLRLTLDSSVKRRRGHFGENWENRGHWLCGVH